jgi:hypothetical protein
MSSNVVKGLRRTAFPSLASKKTSKYSLWFWSAVILNSEFDISRFVRHQRNNPNAIFCGGWNYLHWPTRRGNGSRACYWLLAPLTSRVKPFWVWFPMVSCWASLAKLVGRTINRWLELRKTIWSSDEDWTAEEWRLNLYLIHAPLHNYGRPYWYWEACIHFFWRPGERNSHTRILKWNTFRDKGKSFRW